jgi:hypothetical protein
MAEKKKSKLKKPKFQDEVFSPDERSIDQAIKGRREHFALVCLQGLCANAAYINVDEDELAQNALTYADALIAELDKVHGQA